MDKRKKHWNRLKENLPKAYSAFLLPSSCPVFHISIENVNTSKNKERGL